jgi:hypothetical protein
MNNSFRLSRLTHPRASLFAIILLAVVFGIFGLVASAMHPELTFTPPLARESVMVEGAVRWLGECGWTSFIDSFAH